jgi:hypothetical protein
VNGYVRNLQIWECPSDTGITRDSITGFDINVRHIYGQFGMSYGYRTELPFMGLTMTSVSRPAELHMLADSDGSWHFGDRDKWGTYRFTALYVDGHAKSISRDELNRSWAIQADQG